MNGKIEGQEYSVSKVFSSDFEFIIPSYQKPYAWGKEQTGELLDDLYEFFKDNEDEYYFLVIVSTTSRESAFRIFSVLNSRGLDLLPIDIIKADIIGKISKNDIYTKKGTKDFNGRI